MRHRFLIGCLMTFLVFSTLACSSNSGEIDDLKAQVNSLTLELQQKQDNYDSLLKEHNELEIAHNKALQDVTDLENDNSALNSQLIDAKTQIAKIEASSAPTISSLTTQVGQLQADNDRLSIQVAQLTKQLTPSPDHALTWSQVDNDSDLLSTSWSGYTWQNKVEEIGRQYHASHIYIENETDCNDMVIDIWNMLLAQGIKSVIVIGVLGNPFPDFNECDHAWLNVFDSSGGFITIESTTGKVYYSNTPGNEDYIGSFFYKKPSDLRSDMMKRW